MGVQRVTSLISDSTKLRAFWVSEVNGVQVQRWEVQQLILYKSEIHLIKGTLGIRRKWGTGWNAGRYDVARVV